MIELGRLAVSSAASRSPVVSELSACPYCGLPIPVDGRRDDSEQAAVIESMRREIRQLQETVAMLRGTRAG